MDFNVVDSYIYGKVKAPFTSRDASAYQRCGSILSPTLVFVPVIFLTEEEEDVAAVSLPSSKPQSTPIHMPGNSYQNESGKFEEREEDIISSLELSQGILKGLDYFMCYSNGLFLCTKYISRNFKNKFYIYNPISKEYYQLPNSPKKKQLNLSFWRRPILGLVVGSDYDEVCSGGVTSSSSIQFRFRYKVVLAEASLSNLDTRDVIQLIETFSSETSEWTQSKVAVTVETYNFFLTRCIECQCDKRSHSLDEFRIDHLCV
ncbi:hypothetical protein NE237_003822 [Protea cynaroides]|uniref:F-box protein At3g26010-like beta-propeller domain-containing protein n=1 Tax=Protea cynaroides TaxID=273540 RepID=A0A9Q0QSZ0_9MAGN|nr:hypothetical protein NE237_003822 [Protea cynaroides]